jgi:hypothetical protein
MILTRLAGGLGNQLFQLAASMALRSGDDQQLLFDTRYLSQYATKRKLELRRFFDIPDWFITDEAASWQGRLLCGAMRFRLGRILPGVGVNDANFSKHLNASREDHLIRLLLLDGYFQRDWCWATFDSVRRELATMLRASTASCPSADFDTLLHIRGGDFLTAEHSKDMDCDFYVRGLELLRKRADIASAYVVTDDLQYSKQVIDIVAERVPGLRLFIPEKPSDMFDDFMNIRNARSRVIGKSTFSWWAAALDSNESLTVGPKQWIRGLDRNLVLPWETLLEL